jgi:hypothetical protein
MDATHVASATANVVTSCGLALAGIYAFAIAATPPGRRVALPPVIAFLTGVVLIALAADEGFELHDRAGRWLWEEHAISAPGPINHIDDLFVIGYVVAGAFAMVVLLPILVRSPWFLFGLVIAAALFAGGTAFDALGATGSWTDGAEEGLEAAGAVVVALVFRREASLDRHLVKLPHARLHGLTPRSYG